MQHELRAVLRGGGQVVGARSFEPWDNVPPEKALLALLRYLKAAINRTGF